MPTEILKQEHEVILLVLEGAEKEAQKIRKTGRADTKKLDKILDFFQNFTDRCHHGKEEKHLFAKLIEYGISQEDGPIAVMLTEHEMGREIMRLLIQALDKTREGDRSATDALSEHLDAYVSLLRSHIEKENNILFQIADQILSDKDQIQMSEEFAQAESEEMGQGAHAKYHALAHELVGICSNPEVEEKKQERVEKVSNLLAY